MLSADKKTCYLHEIQATINSPAVITDLIGSYILAEECKAELDALFEIRSPGAYFVQQLYSNCHYGMIVGGMAIAAAGMLYLGLPFLLVDALIHCCKENRNSDFNLYATKITFYTLAAVGTLLSFIVSIIPALMHSGFYALQYQTSEKHRQTSGKEIYTLLKKLENKIDTDSRTASQMITNIREAYEESFHETDPWGLFPSSFFIRDGHSERLHQRLKDGNLSLMDKAEAIAEYMKSKNNNAGKKLFNIILDKIHTTLDVTDDVMWDPFWHRAYFYSYDHSMGYLP